MHPTRDERWLPIPGFEGRYEASDQGRVRSVDHLVNSGFGSKRRVRGRILKQVYTANTGYLKVSLGRGTVFNVHRLILATFVGEPEEFQECCHGNGKRDDNRLVNLRWDDRVGNMKDMVDHGNHRNLRKTHCKYGHEFSEDNTIYGDNGWRICRVCRNARGKESKRKTRALAKARANDVPHKKAS